MPTTSSAVFNDSKVHYQLLDGLRGIAALLVIWYHIFEGYAFAGNKTIETFNHGYLAVDFFFMLSGFVISYAYDDRLCKNISHKDFFKRRLIRLHPMVFLGTLIGAFTFLLQGGVQWNGTEVNFSAVLIASACGVFLLPALPGMTREVRGNGEMFPLNGPSWSLFFEYIGNICYALLLQRLATRMLTLIVILSGTIWSVFALQNMTGYGNIGVGWTWDSINVTGGFLRMLFPFALGMLLSRHFKPLRIKGGFWLCTLLLIILFSIPYIPGNESICLNGIYEMYCITILFPLILWIGASSKPTQGLSDSISRFLGDISYPVYMIHYPIMYLFYAWLIKEKLYTFRETWPIAAGIFFFNIAVAYACLKLYDEPVRKWLSRKINHCCGESNS